MKSSKEIIKTVAEENFNLYKDDWTSSDELETDLTELAIGYYQERNDLEIERDNNEGVEEADYLSWVKEAFEDWESTI